VNKGPQRFQKIVAEGWIATSEGGAISSHEKASVELPGSSERFPRVWKQAEGCPARTIPLKVRVTVERIPEATK